MSKNYNFYHDVSSEMLNLTQSVIRYHQYQSKS